MWGCCCLVDKSCLTLCDSMNYSTPGFPVLHYLPEFAQNSCPLSQRCHPTVILCYLLFLLPSIFASIRVFSNKSALHIRWPKYRSFSFSISSSNEYSGLISFTINWFDLLAVQESLKSLFQTTIQKHEFFGSQLFLWSNSHIHTWLQEKP